MRAASGGAGHRDRIVAALGNPRLQAWAARFPLTRPFVRAEGERIMDLMSGFVDAQVLAAAVETGLLEALRRGVAERASLSLATGVPEARLDVLLGAAAALGLARRRGAGWRLARRGALVLGVPGLPAMIRHHAVLFRDLADPAGFFRDGSETELARFWPYVLGGVDPAAARTYSDLMAESQRLIAEEVLEAVPLRRVRHLLDVGGGTGAFLAAALERHPRLAGTLFDLPEVVAGATRLRPFGDRARIVGGSFRDQPLPAGADCASLVRVLYDHDDGRVAALLGAVHRALPPGGQVVVAEPMRDGSRPADVYFAVYTLAMRTGRLRSPAEIGHALRAAGFRRVRVPAVARPFLTRVVTAVRA